MLVFLVEKPPVAAVVRAWFTLSNTPMPQNLKATAHKTVINTYTVIIHRPLTLIRGWSLL